MMYDKKMKITALHFALNELNLYMDLHPKDERAKELWKKYQAELKILEEENRAAGMPPWPLRSDKHADLAQWVKDPWPWEPLANE